MSRQPRRIAATLVAGFALLTGCSRAPSEPAPSGTSSTVPSPAATAKIPHSPVISDSEVARSLNPKDRAPYAGPTGTVRGVVRIAGDAAPELPEIAAKIKPECEPARAVYGRLFREGAGRTLADAFVGVTGYPHFVPPTKDSVTITARDCAYERRTLGATFGQSVLVQARGTQGFMPALEGGLEGADMIALPNGAPVRLSPTKPGRYRLVDVIRPYVQADLFVVQYRTFDVTDLGGRYEVTGVPVGEVTVNALLPVAMIGAEKKVTVSADRPSEVDLTLTFNKQAYEKSRAAAASPSARAK